MAEAGKLHPHAKLSKRVIACILVRAEPHCTREKSLGHAVAVISNEDPYDGIFIVLDSDDYTFGLRIQTVVQNVRDGLFETVTNLPQGVDQLLGIWRKGYVPLQFLCNDFHGGPPVGVLGGWAVGPTASCL